MNKDITILIIEDDLPLQQTFAQLFRHGGYKAVNNNPGSNVLVALATHKFDLVVLDLSQPNDHALSLFFKIKQNYPLLPVILLTANSESDEIPCFDEEQAWTIIRKPFEPSFLLRCVQSMLGTISKRALQPLLVVY